MRFGHGELDGSVDARQRLLAAEQFQALENWRADCRSTDGDANRLGDLSEFEALFGCEGASSFFQRVS